MTRKDYVLLAQAFARAKPSYYKTDFEKNQWANDVHAIATALQNDNAVFNYERFIAACGDTPELGRQA